jgi:hypothetical protein
VLFSLFVGVVETEWGFIIKFWQVCFPPPRFVHSIWVLIHSEQVVIVEIIELDWTIPRYPY